MIKNVYWSSCKVPVIVVRLEWNLKLDGFFENTKTSIFMKIRPLRAELFHVDGRTDGGKKHDEANSRFSQKLRKAPRNKNFNNKYVHLLHNVRTRCVQSTPVLHLKLR